MAESEYQHYLIKKLERMFPGCIVLKNDPTYIQGFPDLTILHRHYWAVLEVKAHQNAPVRPNQQHYVNKLAGMYFADFIYPENEEGVLRELQRAFGFNR